MDTVECVWDNMHSDSRSKHSGNDRYFVGPSWEKNFRDEVHYDNAPLLIGKVETSGNGMATLNFEHSWGDGVAVMRLMEESFADTNKNHFVHPDTKAATVAEGNVKEIS